MCASGTWLWLLLRRAGLGWAWGMGVHVCCTLKASIFAAPRSFSRCTTACQPPRLREGRQSQSSPLSALDSAGEPSEKSENGGQTAGQPRNTSVAVGRSGSLCGHLARSPPPLTRSACQPEWEGRKRWGTSSSIGWPGRGWSATHAPTRPG